MATIVQIIHLFFWVYTVMIFVRVLGSWFPQWHHMTVFRFIHHYTEPFLGFFRRIIPPIGGVLDLSPMIAIFALIFIEKIIIRLLLG